MAAKRYNTELYHAALRWTRGLQVKNTDHGLPDYGDYVRLAAHEADIDVEAFDPDENQFHDLPEEYELAYLTVKLERLRDKVRGMGLIRGPDREAVA